jgi:hypothetical protein
VIVQLGEGHPSVGVDESLPVDAANARESAQVVGILCSQVAGALSLDHPESTRRALLSPLPWWGLASLTAAEGRAEKSASLFAALEGVSERIKAISVVPSNKPEYERGIAATRASLTEERWSWPWARGVP